MKIFGKEDENTMAEQIIRDFHGKIIAKIETKPNGDKTIRDFYGRILGKYDSATNTKANAFQCLLRSKQNPCVA